MPESSDELIPTRASLLARLKDLQDHDSWQVFFDTYWKLIYGVAVNRGLNPAEAEDVVQETMCAVMKYMPKFNYDKNIGSFKAWLLNMVRWRIANQYQKRSTVKNAEAVHIDNAEILRKLVDERSEDFQALWNQQWEKALLDAAVEKTQRTIDPQKFQIFDLLVKQELPPAQVAKCCGVTVDQVYVVKHRVSQLIKAEVDRLKQQVI